MQTLNIPQLIGDYFYLQPDPSNEEERIHFGTSGHRGSAFSKTFNEAHILATTQAVCDYRKVQKIEGSLFLGIDTHALSTPAKMSAGASFLRDDGEPWSTDKDGIIMNLLAAEIKAVKKDPALIYSDLEKRYGKSYYKRRDHPATPLQKKILKSLDASTIAATTLAGEAILQIYTKAPGNGQPIGGVKIVTQNGWVAFRPSGTEDTYKIYAESFLSHQHLQNLIQGAQKLIQQIFEEQQ